MVTNVPSSDDFRSQGSAFLNLAWDAVLDLLLQFEEALDWDAITEPEQETDYFRKAQRPLALAVALLQQGSEFLVKSSIAEVSPYLLLFGQTSLPKPSNEGVIHFADFKTIDAADLIKIQEAFCSRTLSETFKTAFNRLRSSRNTVFHTVSGHLTFTTAEVLGDILLVAGETLGPMKWMEARRAYLDQVPSSAINPEGKDHRVLREFRAIVNILSKRLLKIHFGFDRSVRTYRCLECLYTEREWDTDGQTFAQLVPTPAGKSRTLHCIVCGETYRVSRRACREEKCPGDVIYRGKLYDHQCLTCGELVE